MKHKIVFFDMDGTLYQSEHNFIQDSTLAAINRLRENGYLIGAVSGRPLNEMEPILNQVHFDYYILMNGGYILDGNLQVISTSPLPDQDVSDLIDFARENNMGLMLQFGDASYTYNELYPKAQYSKYVGTSTPVMYDRTNSFHLRHPAYYTTLLTKNSQPLMDFLESRPNLKLDLKRIHSNGMAFDIFNAAIDKVSGIEQVLNHIGLGWDDVIAFGDDMNDIGMLSKADYSVAMGSARNEVKEAANYITTSVYNNGIFNAIKEILSREL